jgi:hypothetical protein
MTNRIVRPTYDGGHYRVRAERYARAALHEPHPAVRSALLVLAEVCREASDDHRLSGASSDVVWKD